MTTYKRVDGDYTIFSINDNDNVIIDTNTVKIYGNLDIVGNLTYIETTELIVDDPFITVAGNNAGIIANATFQQQGLVTQTSSATYAGLRFNNGTLTWQISPSVDANGAPITAYSDITSTSSAANPGAPENAIQFNVANVFTGSGNLLFDTGNAKLTLTGHEVFGNIVTAPTTVANSVALYHNAQGSGGTGLYVKSFTVEDELVSKAKAIVFAIIF
jgi:hypothetical protein